MEIYVLSDRPLGKKYFSVSNLQWAAIKSWDDSNPDFNQDSVSSRLMRCDELLQI